MGIGMGIGEGRVLFFVSLFLRSFLLINNKHM